MSRAITSAARWPLLAVAAIALAGCASNAIEQNFTTAQTFSKDHLGTELRWLRDDAARNQAQSEVDALLAAPLSADDAVRIALAYSPSVQAMLFETAADSASATQSARLPNPVFAFERLMRNEGGVRELEIDRAIRFSVLDLLLLPSRLRLADYQQQQVRFRLAGEVLQAASETRQAWVRAVAAQQSVLYADQVKGAADASAELARRMQAVGNFSKLQRAREQAFSADAVIQVARARQAAQATREALVRALGLNEAQAARLTLPERLPDLPKEPKGEPGLMRTAMAARIDVQAAQANLAFVAREQGLSRVTGFVNALDIGAVSHSETGRSLQRGYTIDMPLPIFDAGDAIRARAQATYMAALNRTAQLAVDASSQVREGYGEYRTAYDIARHFRDEIVPLRKTISEENVLRYNGMLIGVFELLAEAREQIFSVVQAIDAQRDFWLADAAVQATLLGRPMGPSRAMNSSSDRDTRRSLNTSGTSK